MKKLLSIGLAVALLATGVAGGLACVVEGAAIIGSSPAAFEFTAMEGYDPGNQILRIWNVGTGTLHWSVSDDADWLSVWRTSGRSRGETDDVKVKVDVDGLAVGDHTAIITISDPEALVPEVNIPVTLTVIPYEEMGPILMGLERPASDSFKYWGPMTIMLVGTMDNMQAIKLSHGFSMVVNYGEYDPNFLMGIGGTPIEGGELTYPTDAGELTGPLGGMVSLMGISLPSGLIDGEMGALFGMDVSPNKLVMVHAGGDIDTDFAGLYVTDLSKLIELLPELMAVDTEGFSAQAIEIPIAPLMKLMPIMMKLLESPLMPMLIGFIEPLLPPMMVLMPAEMLMGLLPTP